MPPAPKKKGITLADVKGLKDAKDIVFDSLINPILYPNVYNTLDVIPEPGLLLYGPPGTGKTMFARAIANELNMEFITVSLPDIRGKNSLQTVQMISNLFAKARCYPQGCVLFLDECDDILSRPGSSKAYGVNQILIELNDLKEKAGKVFVLIATNRPWMLEAALLRSGRISAAVYVGLPEKETRLEILSSVLEGIPLAADVDLEKLAVLTEGYSCAQLGKNSGGICNLAKNYASRRWVNRIKLNPQEKNIVEALCWKDFEIAVKETIPAAVKDAERIRENNKFRQMISLQNTVKQPGKEKNTVSEEPEITIPLPDLTELQQLVFSSGTIRNAADYKQMADQVLFFSNDKYEGCHRPEAYSTVVSGLITKFKIKNSGLESAPDRPAIVISEGLNCLLLAFAAFYSKNNPSLALPEPEKVREFLQVIKSVLSENQGNFSMENLLQLKDKYDLFASAEETENSKDLAYAIAAAVIARKLGDIIYGNTFSAGTMNPEYAIDQFALEVINGMEGDSVRKHLFTGMVLSFVTDEISGTSDDSGNPHSTISERFRMLPAEEREKLEQYNFTEENLNRCIP